MKKPKRSSKGSKKEPPSETVYFVDEYIKMHEDLHRALCSFYRTQNLGGSMKDALPTTGKVTNKRYRCTECGHESKHSTNHYGAIYPRCTACGYKHPNMLSMVHECLEPVPEGMGIPERWKTVKLGDILTIK